MVYPIKKNVIAIVMCGVIQQQQQQQKLSLTEKENKIREWNKNKNYNLIFRQVHNFNSI